MQAYDASASCLLHVPMEKCRSCVLAYKRINPESKTVETGGAAMVLPLGCVLS
jgi:hypothetical protein